MDYSGSAGDYYPEYGYLPYRYRKWFLSLRPANLDDVGKRLLHLYMMKYEYGFPYLSVMEPEDPDIHARKYISWHTDQMFKRDWDRVDDETKRKVHLSHLMYRRFLGEFWMQGLDLPHYC